MWTMWTCTYGHMHKTNLYARSLRWRHEKASTERRMKSSVCRAQSRRADLSVRQVIASPPRQSTHWAGHGRTLRDTRHDSDEFSFRRWVQLLWGLHLRRLRSPHHLVPDVRAGVLCADISLRLEPPDWVHCWLSPIATSAPLGACRKIPTLINTVMRYRATGDQLDMIGTQW